MELQTRSAGEHESLVHPDRAEIDMLAVLRALSDPMRLDIVRMLASHPSGEIACGAFGLAATKQNLSHHFRVLREAGVIRSRDEGRNRFSSLRTEDLEARFPGLLSAVVKGSRATVR